MSSADAKLLLGAALVLVEELVHLLYGHRTLADGRCHALDRAVSHVAGEEDPRRARLERHRFALQLPPGAATPVGQDVGSGEEEARVDAPSRCAPTSGRLR